MENVEGRSKPYWAAIGASAGGLEALRDFVRNLGVENGVIYVVLQHMSPQHRSLLTELIGRETPMPVLEITDGTLPEQDTIYIAPPNNDVIVRAGRLRLQPPSSEPASPKPSVDRFFLSLASTMGDRAIGIILSGTGSDGAYGVQAIRAAGGITIAQSEATAKYNGMPLAAIDTGCVDLILPPSRMGARFDRIVRMPRNLDDVDDEAPKDSLSIILQTLQVRTGADFSEYKRSTVRRRIDRRMASLKVEDLSDYISYVRDHPEEIMALYRDMMISVTSFFRNPEEFDTLREQIETDLKGQFAEGLRVWVPGCASGEEAYSLAILLAEASGGLSGLDGMPLQIFATDIDADALSVARRGTYPDTIEKNVPGELLERYFTRTEGGYQVNQVLRERIVFTPHNVCQDPPFSSIDLISCRNLLIYFSNKLQSKVFSRLHYALKPSGLMFLGKSESTSGAEALFKPAGEQRQIFRRRAHPDGSLMVPSHKLGTRPTTYNRVSQRKQERAEVDPFGTLFHALVRSICPNALLVTADLNIHRVYGSFDKYLSLSEGQMRGATISLLREDVRHELRTLIAVALKSGNARTGIDRRVDTQNERLRLRIEVHPLGVAERLDDMAMVFFHEWEQPEVAVLPAAPTDDAGAARRINELETELTSVRESLQQTVEELETANEELQSLNEELQSANEELQSTNEELETTNEELQSTNEELITVNEELQINSHELVLINQELDSVLSNIAAPILVVDARLHIVQCSQSARRLFHIAPGVAKPHLSQLRLPEGFPQLSKFMAEVIQTGARSDADITAGGFNGSITAAPYFNPKGELVGATAIVYEVADSRYRSLETLIEHLPLPIWQNDNKGRISTMNSAAANFLGVSRDDVAGQQLHEVIASTSGATLGAANAEAPLSKLLVPFESNGGQRGVYVVGEPCTDQSSDATGDVDWMLDVDAKIVTLDAKAVALFEDAKSGEKIGLERFLGFFYPDDRDAIRYGLEQVADQAIPFTVLARTKTPNEQIRKMIVRGSAEKGDDGKVARVAGALVSDASDAEAVPDASESDLKFSSRNDER